jgi:hypothetical protein
MNSLSFTDSNSKIFGDFRDNLPSIQEYLIVSFSPSSAPLQKRWRNNGLSADFLADYLSGFLNYEDRDIDPTTKQLEAKDAIGYIANELLENAMKYNNRLSAAPITIQIHLIDNTIIFQITNSIHEKDIEKLNIHIKELLESDPYQLYMDKLEYNAMSENGTESGLGFLTMINDYNAKLGWKFHRSLDRTAEIMVTTMVQILI